MAIDPSIALNANAPVQPNMADYMSKLVNLKAAAMRPEQIQQEISASRTAQAATQAGIPGIEAEAAIKQRAKNFNEWQTKHSKEFVIPSLTEDEAAAVEGDAEAASKAVGTGKPMIDHEGFVKAATAAGFYTEAQAVAGADLMNKAKNITNAQSIVDFTKSSLGYTATLVSSLPPAMQPAKWAEYANASEKLVPGTGKLFGSYSPENLAAARQATATPLDQAELGMRMADQQKTFEETLYSGVGRDSESTFSKAVQDKFLESSPGFPEKELRKLSAFDIKHMQGSEAAIQASIASTVIPAETRIKAEVSKDDLIAAQNAINVGASAATELKKKPLYAAQRFSMLWSKYGAGDAKLKKVRDAVQQYELSTGKKIDDSMTIDGIDDILSAGAKSLTPKIMTSKAVAETGRLSTKGSPSGSGTVRLKNPDDGKYYKMSVSESQEAKAHGWTE